MNTQARAFAGWFALILLGLGQSVAPAAAQQPTQAQASAIRQACRADYQANCAGVPTGGSAALACLQQNAANLSPPCQQALGAVGGGASSMAAPAPPHGQTSPHQMMQIMRAACGTDYRTYCHGVRPGGGAALACLRSHAPSLSQPCQRVLEAAQHRQ